MFEIGRLCVKTAGRDSNKKCIIIDVVDSKTVIIDGQTRRRKVNVKHLEPLDSVLKISKNAKFSEISNAFKELGIELRETKPKKSPARPKKQRKQKQKPEKEPSKAKKAEKPVEKPAKQVDKAEETPSALPAQKKKPTLQKPKQKPAQKAKPASKAAEEKKE